MRRVYIALPVTFAFCSAAYAGSWVGKASYYNYHRGHTASGTHAGAQTAAHRSLPFGTHLRVTNLRNSKSTVVVVVDRGPFTGGRLIDVSASTAETLGFKQNGVGLVKVETINQ
jgi:peptidoglycan lytic transglycosylase